METKVRIEKLIAQNKALINSYKYKLEIDFTFHFDWVAERLFKLEWKNRVLEYILSFFDDDADAPNVDEIITELKERYKNELITRSLMDSSTNSVANLTSLWISECKQDLIADL